MNKLIIAFFVIFITGCSNEKHVTKNEFMEQYKSANILQTMKSVEYLGVKNNRAYIKISTMSTTGKNWSDEIIYSEISELDKDFLNKINNIPGN